MLGPKDRASIAFSSGRITSNLTGVADVVFESALVPIWSTVLVQTMGGRAYVPFPATFAETLALHMDAMRRRGAVHLFESSWKKPYSTRGVRAMLSRYAAAAGLTHPISPHQLRHFLFTWLKTQGIDDALIQPYSGHESRQSLDEVYSRLALADAQQRYDQVITRFPV